MVHNFIPTTLHRIIVRKATIKNYVLIYKVHEDTKAVIIHRFFYIAQDYVKLI
jgi:toxin ParE1/3/4